MGLLVPVLSIALAAHLVSLDQYPLRKGCEADAPVVAHLQKGDAVTIRFALAGGDGTCYKVSVRSGGRTLQGYVSPDAITGVQEFERERRAAPAASLPAMLRTGRAQIRDRVPQGGPRGPGARAAALLEQNRPDEALDLLRPLLRSQRGDPGLWALAGYAAYRGDDPRRAMEYWKRSLALRPSPIVERLLRKAQREARQDKSRERLFGTRFLLRYNRRTMAPATARRVLGMLEHEFNRISAQLGCPVDERIVAIVQTPAEYRKTTAAAEWSAGQYTGRIRVAVDDQSRLDETTRRRFAHEIVHACLARIGDFPVWLHEGLAQKLSGQRLTPGQLAQVKRLARAGRLPHLDHLTQTWTRMSARNAYIAYHTALAAIDLFCQHYPGLGIRNLVHNPRLLPQVTAELDRLLREGNRLTRR